MTGQRPRRVGRHTKNGGVWCVLLLGLFCTPAWGKVGDRFIPDNGGGYFNTDHNRHLSHDGVWGWCDDSTGEHLRPDGHGGYYYEFSGTHLKPDGGGGMVVDYDPKPEKIDHFHPPLSEREQRLLQAKQAREAQQKKK